MKKDSMENEQIPEEIYMVPTTSIEQPIESGSVGITVSELDGRREVVKSAGFVAMGNLGSSLMGMLRQTIVSSTGMSGPFLAAIKPMQTFYDFLVNGAVSGALIPTFNDYSEPEQREELRRLVYTLVNIILLITILASIIFLFISPWLVKDWLVSGFERESDKELTLRFAQIIFFALIALGPFSILLAALYALKEFGWPAFATVAFHIGIIVGAIVSGWIGTQFLGEMGLAFGVLIGVIGEIALLLPGIHKQKLYYMFVFDFKQPALRRILRLYAPVGFSFLVSMAIVFVDVSLQSATPCVSSVVSSTTNDCGKGNIAALGLATTLIQFPIGLVAAALQFAVLPLFTTFIRQKNEERFKETLLLGLRLGLLLMIPAMAGLIVLSEPITLTLYQHGKSTVQDTELIAIALRYYAIQLPFVAMDQLLIAAFYARKNTLTPVLVGFLCILGYLAIALPFYRTWGMPSLATANTVQNSLHGIILLVLLRLNIGPLYMRKLLPTLTKIFIATLIMVGIAWVAQSLLNHIAFFSMDHFTGRLFTLIVSGGLATAVYFICTILFKIEEIGLLKETILAKLGKNK